MCFNWDILLIQTFEYKKNNNEQYLRFRMNALKFYLISLFHCNNLPDLIKCFYLLHINCSLSSIRHVEIKRKRKLFSVVFVIMSSFATTIFQKDATWSKYCQVFEPGVLLKMQTALDLSCHINFDYIYT